MEDHPMEDDKDKDEMDETLKKKRDGHAQTGPETRGLAMMWVQAGNKSW